MCIYPLPTELSHFHSTADFLIHPGSSQKDRILHILFAMLSEDEMVVKVIEDLKDGPYACSSLVRLSGGFVNFTYRGTLLSPLPDKSSTVVIKHAEPYLAIMNTWKANVIRSVFSPLPPLLSTHFHSLIYYSAN